MTPATQTVVTSTTTDVVQPVATPDDCRGDGGQAKDAHIQQPLALKRRRAVASEI